MASPLVSIVILNWNGRNYLQQFLPSILASTYGNMQVVVIDNASTDDSIPFLQHHFPAVKVIRHTSNFGFAKGYNEGLRQVNSGYYVLLNSDVEVAAGWIEPVIALIESAGAAGGWLDYLGYPFARGRVFDTCEEDTGQYDIPAPVFWASGAAMFVRAEVYHKLGGLDEFMFAHQEEIDFCWRAQLAGYTIFSCPQSTVYHVGGGTLPKGNARKVFLNF